MPATVLAMSYDDWITPEERALVAALDESKRPTDHACHIGQHCYQPSATVTVLCGGLLDIVRSEHSPQAQQDRAGTEDQSVAWEC